MSDTFDHEGDALESFNDDRYYGGGPRSSTPRCKYCGREVEWLHSGVRWRMYEPGEAVKLHVCQRVASPDEFEDVA
jgi:hypothetical protein